jgi:hypothetical protein
MPSDLVGWAGFEPATSASRTGLQPFHQVLCGLQRTRWRLLEPISRVLWRKDGGKPWLGRRQWPVHDCRPGRHRHPLRSHARHRRLRSPRPPCRASMWGYFQRLRNVGQTAIGNKLTPGLTGEALMKVCEGGRRRAGACHGPGGLHRQVMPAEQCRTTGRGSADLARSGSVTELHLGGGCAASWWRSARS